MYFFIIIIFLMSCADCVFCKSPKKTKHHWAGSPYSFIWQFLYYFRNCFNNY